MSEIEPRNNLSWRITLLEREVERLKAHQPDVVAERVGMLSLRVAELKAEINEDLGALRIEMRERDDRQAVATVEQARSLRDFRRTFTVVFSGVGIALVAAVIATVLNGGTG